MPTFYTYYEQTRFRQYRAEGLRRRSVAGGEARARARRDWRKLHLAVDADNFSIVAHTLTDSQTDDPLQVGPLLSQTDGTITQVTADGAYDGRPTYNTIAGHGEGITVAIPPRVTAVPEDITGPPCQRDRHLGMIQEKERLFWQKAVRYISGNHDGVLENAYRIPVTCPEFRSTENRGCHRCGGTEPSAVGSPHPFCP